MPGPPHASKQHFFLDRVLGLERHEYFAVAWSFIYFFCVLSAYYMLRSVRETMAVEGGVQNVPWLFSSTFVVMLAVTPLFGWVASRYPRRRFLPWVYYFFAINILLFWAGFSYAINNGLSFVWLGRAFFVWLSVFNLFVVSVFWSFMADIYTREQGRRLFGVISAGGSAGALLGPLATGGLVVTIGFHNLLPISASLLLFGVYCITRLRSWVESEHRDDVANTVASTAPLGGNLLGGITLITRSRLVGEAFASTDERTRTFAFIDAATNTMAMLVQLLIVKRAVWRFGVGITLSLLPVISIAGFALVALNPSFLAVAAVQAIRRAVGFGLSKPTNDMLYSVVSPEEKYKSKNFIDTAVYRGGDLLGTWTVRILWGLGYSGISLIMLPFAALWVAIAMWLGKAYRRYDNELARGDRQ
jgi:AAA family ATP:ADP antiporter